MVKYSQRRENVAWTLARAIYVFIFSIIISVFAYAWRAINAPPSEHVENSTLMNTRVGSEGPPESRTCVEQGLFSTSRYNLPTRFPFPLLPPSLPFFIERLNVLRASSLSAAKHERYGWKGQACGLNLPLGTPGHRDYYHYTLQELHCPLR